MPFGPGTDKKIGVNLSDDRSRIVVFAYPRLSEHETRFRSEL